MATHTSKTDDIPSIPAQPAPDFITSRTTMDEATIAELVAAFRKIQASIPTPDQEKIDLHEQMLRLSVFNPNEHLMKIGRGSDAKDYLQVAWRLVWFRLAHPHGSIETELYYHDPDRQTEEEGYVWNQEKRRSEKITKTGKGYAIFKAVVKDGKGGIATGYKSEKAASFPDYLEKCETGSIGRALAALGFGTQFTGDELNEFHRIVDAPVSRQKKSSKVENEDQGDSASNDVQESTRASSSTSSSNQSPSSTKAIPSSLSTTNNENETRQRQIQLITKLSAELGENVPNFDAMSGEALGKRIQELNGLLRTKKQSASAAVRA